MVGIVERRLREAEERLRAAGIERPLFEAQLLLAQALGISRLEVLTGPRSEPGHAALQRFQQMIARRATREPLAYIRGTQEFYGLEFVVTSDVLVPRPETELLVDLALERLRGERPATLIDVGTGSGCVPVAVAAQAANVQALAVDYSWSALEIAALNIRRRGVRRQVRLVRSDLLSAVGSRCAEMIVSNPPYIPSSEVAELQPEVRDYEPKLALDGGEDGLEFQRRLVIEAQRVLRPGGMLAVEVAMGQAGSVAALLAGAGFSNVDSRRDLAGIERVVFGVRE